MGRALSTDTGFELALRSRLDALDAAGLRRVEQLRPGGQDGSTACANTYLGAQVYGAGSSRLVSGARAAHRSFEREIADWLGTADAILFNSGYNANVGAIPALAGRGDTIFSDALNHASIIDGIRLSSAQRVIFPHRDLQALDQALGDAPRDGLRLIVSESVFSMDGDLAPLADLAELARKHEAALYVDEAHAIGVLGPQGRGLAAELGLGAAIDVQVGTCGKSLGGFGAWAAGSEALREWLYNRARSLVFTTALPEPVVEANRQGLAVVREGAAQARLWAVIRRIADRLAEAGWWQGEPVSAIFPLLVGAPEQALALAQAIARRGFFVQAIRPPTVPVGTSRLRLTAAADYEDGFVDALVLAITESAHELGISPQRSSHGQEEFQ